MAQNFDGTILGKKKDGGHGLVALQSFRSLKKGTRALNLRSNEPSYNILIPVSQYNHPFEKTWYDDSDGVIFIKILWLFGGVFPFFETRANFLRPAAFNGKE